MPMKEPEREPPERRAGTVLDHRFTRVVHDRRGRHQGHIDSRHRVYQQGGTADQFVFWKLRLLTMPVEVWDEVNESDADSVEMVDHKRNEAWVASVDDFRAYGQRYSQGDGLRYGVPLRYVTVYHANGDTRKPEGSMD